MTRRLRTLFLASLLLAGCSGGGPSLVPVRGSVTVEGEPSAEGLTLTFHPIDAKGSVRPATGKVGGDGRFELTSFRPGDGAYAGEYKVVISLPPMIKLPPKMKFPQDSKFVPEPVDPSKKMPEIHANYQDAAKTPLRRVIPPPEGEIKIELKKNGS